MDNFPPMDYFYSVVDGARPTKEEKESTGDGCIDQESPNEEEKVSDAGLSFPKQGQPINLEDTLRFHDDPAGRKLRIATEIGAFIFLVIFSALGFWGCVGLYKIIANIEGQDTGLSLETVAVDRAIVCAVFGFFLWFGACFIGTFGPGWGDQSATRGAGPPPSHGDPALKYLAQFRAR